MSVIFFLDYAFLIIKRENKKKMINDNKMIMIFSHKLIALINKDFWEKLLNLIQLTGFSTEFSLSTDLIHWPSSSTYPAMHKHWTMHFEYSIKEIRYLPFWIAEKIIFGPHERPSSMHPISRITALKKHFPRIQFIIEYSLYENFVNIYEVLQRWNY